MYATIYAVWDSSADASERQAELAVIWWRSWRAHGWTPRLLLPGRKPRKPRPPGPKVALTCINYGCLGGEDFSPVSWEDAGFGATVIDFAGSADPDFILDYIPAARYKSPLC